MKSTLLFVGRKLISSMNMKTIALSFALFTTLPAWSDDGDTFCEETAEGVMLTYTVISESEKTCMVGKKFTWYVPTARAKRIRRANETLPSGDITIPEVANGYAVIRIEDLAFKGAAITSVVIPNSVKTIGIGAFSGCADLKFVKLPNQITILEGQTFMNCENLTSIEIPKGVTSIRDGAFYGCKQLKDVVIPSSVEFFGENVFSDTGFTSLPKLPDHLTTIPNGMFYSCAQLTSVEIPQNITRIGDTAFGRCPFSEIEIPSSVKDVGIAAFANCKNLTSIVIPDNVVEIGMNGFLGCSELKTVTLSNNLSSISKGTFNECTNLESIIIPSGVKFIGESAFQECSSLRFLSLPETVDSIDIYAFRNCHSLTSITIPGSVTGIGSSAFNGCSSATSVNIGSNVKTIGGWAFYECQSLTSVSIPGSVSEIQRNAFDGCSGITSVAIGSNVKTIGVWAFRDCKNLQNVYCYAENVPETEGSAFVGSGIRDIPLYVPPASVSAYQAAEPWSKFGAIVPLETEPAYRPLVEEGKHWTYDSFMPMRPSEYNHYYYYDLKGDTLIAGKNCLKMYSDNRANDSIVRYEAALYEENKKVFCFFPEKEEAVLLYDFGCEVGDTLYVYEEQMVVTDIRPVIPGDVLIRKYTLQSISDEPENYGEVFWIEGVGAAMDFFGMVPVSGNYNTLHACEVNGEKLYTADTSPQRDYRPFVEEGKVWKVGFGLGSPVQMVEYYYFDGDTIIDGKSCKKMMCQRYVSPDYPDYDNYSQLPSLNYMRAWYEEDMKVYVFDDEDKQFQLMYDFSLEANGILWTDKNSSSYILAGPRQTGGVKGFKGIYRNVVLYDWGSSRHTLTWLEGVGTAEGPGYSISYRLYFDYLNPFLMSCSVGDEVIYLNDEYEDGATPGDFDARKRRFDFTHTIKTKPKSPMKREAEESLYGEYNELQLGINLEPLADAYQVSITDETGNVVYEKAIDAAGIVGLHIDISAYEEGLYTITLENDQESFTGEFEARTTGLSPLLQEKPAETIYNLQGQRLNSLRKGLNIVNGRKVYVK